MTAPQTLATIFALISVGSALTLALMASASAALDALAAARDRSLVSVRDDRPGPLSTAVCRAHQMALARVHLQ